MEKRSVMILVAAGIVLVAAVILFSQPAAKNVVGNSSIQAEVQRLTQMTMEGTATSEDFDTLEEMVEGDEAAGHEVHEIATLVRYGEFMHAGHGLEFLAGYLETGEESLCPGHMLAHYYVFSRHGEAELAEEALDEAKEQMPEWTEKADDSEAAVSINGHIESIESGNSAATNEEIDYLMAAPCA